MKILEVNKFFYPRRGAELHMLDVIALLGKRGHEVRVFSMEHQDNVTENFPASFVSHVGYNKNDSTLSQRVIGAGRLFWSFEARRKMEELLKEWQPEVVHLHNIYHQLSPSILGPLKKRNIPVVMTVHDYNLISPDKDMYYPEVGQKYWKFLFIKKYSLPRRILLIAKMYWNNYFRFYEKGVDLFIAPSDYVKKVLVSAGTPAEKITVLPHFILERENTRAHESTLHNVPQAPFALYPGSVSEEKGIKSLVRIFENIQQPLVVVGENVSGFQIPSSKYTSFIGKQTKEEVRQWMKQSSLVVSASPLPETFGLIALEAVTLGKPFFGLKSGAFPEIIKNGENGFLAQDTNELEAALKNFFSGGMSFDAERIKRVALGQFGEENYANELESIFTRVKKML